MLHAKLLENRPSWSCDQDAANKLSFPRPKEAPHNFPLIGQAVLEKMFDIVYDGRRTTTTTDGRRTISIL